MPFHDFASRPGVKLAPRRSDSPSPLSVTYLGFHHPASPPASGQMWLLLPTSNGHKCCRCARTIHRIDCLVVSAHTYASLLVDVHPLVHHAAYRQSPDDVETCQLPLVYLTRTHRSSSSSPGSRPHDVSSPSTIAILSCQFVHFRCLSSKV